MTKPMKNPISPKRHNSGFTLIEMLVVAALIAIFAGLAVFNIVEQLNREKEKAAIAETRSIATAMSFAHDDLGFYPKLCWLKFGQMEFMKYISDNTMPPQAVDWFERGGPTMANMIKTKWGEKYMAGGMPDKFVTMSFPALRGGGTIRERWPADPWNQPYMAYLVKIDTPPGNPTAEPTVQWADDSLGDKANYFAGIVSYGRNKVPGYAWNDTRVGRVDVKALRLFTGPDPADQRLFTMNVNAHTPAHLNLFVNSEPNPDLVEPFDGNPPLMRDAGSDDKYFEF